MIGLLEIFSLIFFYRRIYMFSYFFKFTMSGKYYEWKINIRVGNKIQMENKYTMSGK